MHTIISVLDIMGVIVFAASGALVASRKEMDLIGFGLMACLTGVGGGTLRDVLLDRTVFWIADPLAIWICLAIAVLLFFTAHRVQRRYPVLLWADALGIALYGVMGAELARRSGAGPLVAIVMGMMTATFGGLLRDVVCAETPLILRKEVYATCAALAAATHILLNQMGVTFEMSAAAGFGAGFALRALGIVKGLSLPSYKARPGRDY
ncbi:trimeric intracellular cation channel family protein [Thalassospiraceae bacterium LMO-JJ14]|nr:trimeric intracellular cation channel family protein [Thalassospiraceae bacterium LMO-JJ14]